MSKRGLPPRALVLHSPYESFREMARSILGAVGGLALERWNIQAALQQAQSPTLLLHGDADDVIPYQHSLRLHQQRDKFTCPCHLVTLHGASHNNWDPDTHITQPIREFLKSRFFSCYSASECNGLKCAETPELVRLIEQSAAIGIEKCTLPNGRKSSAALSNMKRAASGSAALMMGASLGSLAASGRSLHRFTTPADDVGDEPSDSQAIKSTAKVMRAAGLASAATAAAAPVTAPVLGPLGASTAAASFALGELV